MDSDILMDCIVEAAILPLWLYGLGCKATGVGVVSCWLLVESTLNLTLNPNLNLDKKWPVSRGSGNLAALVVRLGLKSDKSGSC